MSQRWTSLFVMVLLFAGCGDNGGRVPVTGLVTFDGKPLEDGNIIFGGDQGAAGVGKIVNGAFTMSETGEETGVLPGKYSVLISSWFEELGAVRPDGSFSPGKPRIPLYYRDPEKSGLSVEVKQGEENYFTFELTSEMGKQQ